MAIELKLVYGFCFDFGEEYEGIDGWTLGNLTIPKYMDEYPDLSLYWYGNSHRMESSSGVCLIILDLATTSRNHLAIDLGVCQAVLAAKHQSYIELLRKCGLSKLSDNCMPKLQVIYKH